MRLISICPSNTELVEYLGLTSQLVGVDDFSDWPASIQSLPKLGPDLSIDMDKVEALKPDLVIASLSVPGMEKNIEELKKRGLPYIVTNPQSLQDIGDSLLEAGKACGVEEQAKEIANQYFSQLKLFQQVANTIENHPALYWEWWPKPVFTPGRINWLTEISELAGGTNVFATEHTANFQTSWDDVKQRDPDYILLSWVGVQTEKIDPEIVKKRPGWIDLQAVQSGRVAVMEEEYFCRPSPRLLIGLHKLAMLLHPDSYRMIELDPLFKK
ncbi:iron complex transport system substrate-binding protein [Bacillus ectoiniformans]|uniref:cobalamin-binding protein n=1 Tax=Bacillus ectoiniformans TaxID=1494429 RepID=UPI0019561C59|nr:cobalamin-binding protein [Bacillus ectoiniformans]MBM7648521.1 iron complex transport system substrate-binding protein [Bacillus ectoiniformans]